MYITKNPSITKWCTALIKSGTKEPIKHSSVLPVEAFHHLFNSWNDNDSLSIGDLRLKAITLLALGLMLRPSDIAPKGKMFDNITGETKNFVFSTAMISFAPGGLTITFLGIKNDSMRTGFEVFLPFSAVAKMDPVETLRTYIKRTDHIRSGKAVFIGLKNHSKLSQPLLFLRFLNAHCPGRFVRLGFLG